MRTSWPELHNALKDCRQCSLAKTRKSIVLGEGNPHAVIMFIGEGPGAQEDEQGRPFVGAAGQLLDKMLAAIDLKREDVYIANIVKCRPPGNRAPLPDEADACLPFLRMQVALVRPRIIVLLGATALKYIFPEAPGITRARGTWILRKNVNFMPTFHPAALLRDQSKKHLAWADFKAIRDKLQTLSTEEKHETNG